MRFLTVFIVTLSLFQLTARKIMAQKSEHPNIVWITSEDNSKHYLKIFDKHGVETPNIEKLAQHGIIYDNAFSNAPVCSAARSTLIASCYGPRIASHYHRQIEKVNMPEGVKMFPVYLRQAGYYTANCKKEDYNINKTDKVWDDSSKKATWRNRKKGQPFFYMYNLMTTHESCMQFSEETYRTVKTKNDPNKCFIQPNHPNTPLFRYSNAWYRDKMQVMDKQVGDVVAQLKKDGLLKNTIIFYFGDHGGVLPGSKGYIKETGLEAPLVVYVPDKYKNLVPKNTGKRTDDFVSFVDFGATVLNLAGIKVPKGMDGKPFLGKNVSDKTLKKHDVTYSYADRMDEKYDMVRGVRKGNFKYIRNFYPFNFNGLMNNYRYKQLAYQEWAKLYKEHKLNKVQSQFFKTKAPEGLYDISKDPFEINNLANNPTYKKQLIQLRNLSNKHMKNLPDLSLYPEFYLIKNAFGNTAKFGQEHKSDISRYLDVANLMYQNYDKIKNTLKKKLTSTDTWERYWALIVCCKFKTEAKEFYPLATKMAKEDPQLINRVRAAQFLGLSKELNPVKLIENALYKSTDGTQALLMLNAIVMLRDGYTHYKFNLEVNKMSKPVKDSQMVQRRFLYLGLN